MKRKQKQTDSEQFDAMVSTETTLSEEVEVKQSKRRRRKLEKKARPKARRWKGVAWLVGIVIALAGVAGFGIAVMARHAVNDYRLAATSQLNKVIDQKGETAELPVELSWVPLGNRWSNYARINELQKTYRELLASVQNYVAVLDAQNQLVSLYNTGIDGDDPLNGDVLTTTNKYLALMKNNYANEEASITALNDLSTAIASSSSYSAISSQVSVVLMEQDAWLSSTRTDLEARITQFEQEINQ